MSSARHHNKTYSAYSGKRAGYRRDKDLPRLTGLWPSEINSNDIKTRERIITILRNALRIERQRGKSGHWCYDINRHLALKKALAQELSALQEFVEKEKRLSRPKTGEKDDNRKIAQADRDGIHPPADCSHPVLFLALPTASSS